MQVHSAIESPPPTPLWINARCELSDAPPTSTRCRISLWNSFTVLQTMATSGISTRSNQAVPGRKGLGSGQGRRVRMQRKQGRPLEMPMRRRCLFPSALKITISIWGGVDTADQLRSYYGTQLTSFRTWWPMLFWAYDTMITNAYIIFKDMPQSPGAITHEEFRLQCV